MNRKIVAKLLLPLMLLAFTLGCSTIKGWFGKDKKADAPPEVLAEKGIGHLKKKKYIDAIETFEKVRDRYPYSEQALLAQIKLADAYFYQKKYDEAIQAYKDFEKLHPTNKAVPYCIFRRGLCYYRQRSTIDRDQTYTTKALEEFRVLKQKFPQSEYVPKAEQYMARCRLDLAEHEFYIAEFYYRTDRYQAALDRYQALIQEYPEFPKKAEAQAKIDECQKILARPDHKPKPTFFTPIANLFDAKW
jgi:outer membrane protein assembly factor BamD